MDSDSEGSSCSVESLQQEIMNKLSEFGDSLLNEDEYEEMKKKKKRTKKSSSQNDELESHNLKRIQKKKQKKKKKKLKSDDKTTEAIEDSTRHKPHKSNKLQSWKEELELDLICERTNVDSNETADNVNDGETKQKRKAPVIVVFEDRKKKRIKKSDADDETEAEQTETTETSGPQLSLKQARRDVRNFGISGFSYKDKKQIEQQRAIKLGAKPPKKEYVNYKTYMEMQKEKRQAEMQQRELDRKLGLKVSKKSSGKRDKKDPLEGKLKRFGFWSDPTLDKSFDGQVGRYRDGIQVLRKTDIEKIKKTNRKK
ncbi:uncharacterized protein C1orf131 homolog [Ptychodera flava]|uniref:uncharacterized protein C1orf131 homolog n=1 Tax=Ptychodera flava TaxID=63121 RepID=UPI003969FF14